MASQAANITFREAAMIQHNSDLDGDSTMNVLSRAQQGDRSAVRVLIERALPPLRRWARGRLPRGGRGAVDTEDVLQDAVLRTLKRISTFEHRTVDALQRYLRKSVLNSIRDIARRVRRRGTPAELPDAVHDDAPSPEDAAILRQRTDKFVEALARLQPLDRQAIIWRFELGYSYDDIARHLGKSLEATYMLVSRARKRLMKEMLLPPLD
jgi:RNA polymerase sigma-70 factor (ECF subfamily)